MDAGDLPRPRWLVVALTVAALAATLAGIEPEVRVDARTDSDLELVRWAIGRYGRAGIDLPSVRITFHPDAGGCDGNSGLFRRGRVEMCSDGSQDYRRRVLLHELAHAWGAARLDAMDRERFLDLRGLAAWDERRTPWGQRGAEQAAEVLTWGIGDPSMPVLLHDRDDGAALASAYRSLTGSPPPRFGRP
jgi:hypothetical protein